MANNKTKLMLNYGTKRLYYPRNRKSEFQFNMKLILSARIIRGKKRIVPEAILEILFSPSKGFYEEDTRKFLARLNNAKNSRGSLRCRLGIADLKRFVVYMDSFFEPPIPLTLSNGAPSKLKVWNKPYWQKYAKRFLYWRKKRHETKPKQMRRIENIMLTPKSTTDNPKNEQR